MSLFSALNTSTNGLRYTHDALGLLSQNVANASNPNYVRREYVFDQGLQGSTIRRALEPYVQRQMWRESAKAGIPQPNQTSCLSLISFMDRLIPKQIYHQAIMLFTPRFRRCVRIRHRPLNNPRSCRRQSSLRRASTV